MKIVARVIVLFVLYAVLSVLAVWTIGTAGSDIGLVVVLIVPLMITAGVWGRLDGSAMPRRELVTTWVAVAAIVAALILVVPVVSTGEWGALFGDALTFGIAIAVALAAPALVVGLLTHVQTSHDSDVLDQVDQGV